MSKNKRKRVFTNLPQKQMMDSIGFDEKVVCDLNLSLRGIDSGKATQIEKDGSITDHCLQPIWPVFMPQCASCLLRNKHTHYREDKKGNRYRVIETLIKDEPTLKEEQDK